MLNLNERCSYKQLLKKHKRKKLRYNLGALNIELVTRVLFQLLHEKLMLIKCLSCSRITAFLHAHLILIMCNILFLQ